MAQLIISASVIIMILSMWRLDGFERTLTMAIMTSVSVSLFSATLGSSLFSYPSGPIFGLIGGLFFGTYTAFLVDGATTAAFASFFSPLLGVIFGFFITRYLSGKNGYDNE